MKKRIASMLAATVMLFSVIALPASAQTDWLGNSDLTTAKVREIADADTLTESQIAEINNHYSEYEITLNQKAEAVMISNGINMEGFMSSQITAGDFGEDTLVLTMEAQQRQKLLEMFPEAKEENVQVLTELVGDELEILDPYGGTLQSYGLCFETMNKSIKKLVKLLNEGE